MIYTIPQLKSVENIYFGLKKNQKHMKDRICFEFRKGIINMQVDVSFLIEQNLILF